MCWLIARGAVHVSTLYSFLKHGHDWCVHACLFEAVCDVTTVPSHLNLINTQSVGRRVTFDPQRKRMNPVFHSWILRHHANSFLGLFYLGTPWHKKSMKSKKASCDSLVSRRTENLQQPHGGFVPLRRHFQGYFLLPQGICMQHPVMCTTF